MTQLEQYTGHPNGVDPWRPAQQVVRVQPRAVVALTEWAQAAQAAYEVAVKLVATSFVPEGFRDKPHEACAAILAGDEVGLSPMAALRSFDIIQGTAAPRAMTLRAIVQSKGHEIWVHESTDTRAIVRGRRTGSSIVQESTWDMARARGLKLANKDNWQKQPKAMLVARATAELCRLIASDAILGVPYAVEEIADGVVDDQVYDQPGAAPADEQPPARPSAQRTAQRRTAPRTQPSTSRRTPPPIQQESAGPPLPGEEGYDEPPELPVDDRAATRAQLTKLGATFTELGIKDRAERLAIVAALVGRPIESSADLSLREISGLFDTIAGLQEANGEHTTDLLRTIVEEKAGEPA